VTYPGDPNVPQQPYQQPYGQPVSGQPYGQPVPGQPYGPPSGPQPGYGPPAPAPAGGQQGLKWALIGGAAFLVLVAVIVGGYFTFQKIFVDTPTEVVQAYFTEATRDHPDPSKLKPYLCKDLATKLEKDLSNDGTDNDSDSKVLTFKVNGETVSGDSATVYTSFTVRDNDTARTTSHNLTMTLIKEDGDWKICGFDD
jgi:hypothetical protein